jgi:hypothetical protein
MVYLLTPGAIKSALNNDAQEGKMNIRVDTVQVVKKAPWLVGTMGPDDESVIHVTEVPPRGGTSLKLAVTGGSAEAVAMLSVCRNGYQS